MGTQIQPGLSSEGEGALAAPWRNRDHQWPRNTQGQKQADVMQASFVSPQLPLRSVGALWS